jgi:hypothetical protein
LLGIGFNVQIFYFLLVVYLCLYFPFTQVLELEGHPFYVAVQYHPEYISRPLSPSPPYLGLILARSVILYVVL